eukprot:15365242-Ditylum_brightwellii.AAC.1
MGLGIVLATAEMLKNDDRQTGETRGTICNEVIFALKEVTSNLSNITEQREKVLKVLNMDASKSWGDEVLVWCNAVQTKPSEELGINGRYLPFIVNKKEEDFNSPIVSTSHHFTAKSSIGEEFSFERKRMQHHNHLMGRKVYMMLSRTPAVVM